MSDRIRQHIVSIINHIRSLNSYKSAASSTDEYIRRNEILSTRLYLSLLIVCMCGILMITAVPRQKTQVTIKTLQLADYERIQFVYDSLVCSCSTNIISYSNFVTLLLPSFHQVCSSFLVSERWTSAVFNTTKSNLTTSRIFLSAHFRLLAGICNYSRQVLEDELVILGLSNFVSDILLSHAALVEQINSTLEQFQVNVPNTFSHALDFIVDTILGNQAISVFGSNWQATPAFSDYFSMTAHYYGMYYLGCVRLKMKCYSNYYLVKTNLKFISHYSYNC